MEYLKKIYVRSEADLPKIKGKYLCRVSKRIVEWDYDPDDKECGLYGDSRQTWLAIVELYYQPVTEEELQNELCIYPRITR